jgi:hypothetical protein
MLAGELKIELGSGSRLGDDAGDRELNSVSGKHRICTYIIVASTNVKFLSDYMPSSSPCFHISEDHPTPTAVKKFTCPKCSAIFSGKAFLNFHLKKAHPNLQVIVQTPEIKTPPSKRVSTQIFQKKEDPNDRILPPEIASRLIKYSARVGTDIKHLTLNGYAFRKSGARGNTSYWRCKLLKECSCFLDELSDTGTFRRGQLGWASDGVTHLSHPPDFKKFV